MAAVMVLFEVTIKKGKMEDYLATAALLKASLAHAPGLIRSERFSSLSTEGKLLSLSVWESEESVSQWRSYPAHRQSQLSGRAEDFMSYQITVVTPTRCYTMQEREEAPSDSNQYFGMEV